MIHKTASKTGVADYFAILGIDSFTSASQDDVDTECNGLEELDTPKSANLTVAADSQCNDNIMLKGNDEMEKKEEQMHLQRFHREITHLALLSQVDEKDDSMWKISQSNHATPSDSTLDKLNIYGAPLHISGMQCDSVQIAHQTRGQYLNAAPVDSLSTSDSSSNNEGQYYIPAVADVSIQYAKVHPLSIPNYTYPVQQQEQLHETNNEQQKLPTIVAAAAAAKTLTSLARKTTVLGKEIVGEGLVSVVKNVRGAAASSGNYTAHTHGVHADHRVSAANFKNQTQHLDNTHRELHVVQQKTSFEDTHGEIPRWKEPSSRGSSGTRQHFFPDTPAPKTKADSSLTDAQSQQNENGILHKPLSDLLPIPSGYDEWIIPPFCQTLCLPTPHQLKKIQQQKLLDSSQQSSAGPILLDRTHVLPSPIGKKGRSSPSSMGVEAMYISPLSSPIASQRSHHELEGENVETTNAIPDPTVIPSIVPRKAVPTTYNRDANTEYVYIPILAIRRQRIGEEERYHEDSAVIDLQLSCLDSNGMPPIMPQDDDDEDESKPMVQHGSHSVILKRSSWTPCLHSSLHRCHFHPIILVRRNVPNGFADLTFPARVLDRFPQKNYRDMPFPEEELPMFCYARGSLLKRDKLRNLPIPKSFGFVVKNERGNSIYVSCLSFIEPLTRRRQHTLDMLSIGRRRTSLPHRRYWQRMQSKPPNGIFDKFHMVAFDDVVTFESKTICLVGRYPFWTALRQFLTHLHLLSGLSSDTPIERHISHLLLSVPIPKPGGQCVLIPMSTMREPMALLMPPLKDLPLLDLSYKMLFSALDVPTVVTIVLGFLCLEKKVILTSTRQTLLLDCCELLKSLLFPFELCAPYVPHLTEPFMSCLEFPGATFVGIHDDGDSSGLANTVRQNIPEDSIIVELDSGEIKSDGNRYETLKSAYQIIPSDSRSVLIKEVESLCQDAGIIPGQEPLDYSIDSMIDSTVPSNLAEAFGGKNDQTHEPLDDRAVRDCFLRFFCSILGGYERYLVVPDADFLISGNDWFDSSKFLAAAPSTRAPFLSSLVSTQLFQSFIQRRTEASDVHLVLFDECITEYHSSKMPYGLRGNGDLLVDQCATEPDVFNEDDSFIDKSEIADKSCSQAGSDTATHASFDSEIQFALNGSGDIVTVPAVLPNERFTYCVDGQPSFPTCLHRLNFLPKEPEHLSSEFNELPAPILTRSDREREEATRLLNTTISRRGPQKQHRCLWQLPKFMGSQFLGAWLMCIPSQLVQQDMALDDKSSILLRALGALRTLRSHRRIIADEAAYRALIVACGKCGSDRRIELMKLYGLMRTDGIFPNAVTLGQYTKSIAEGYSRKDAQSKVGMQISVNTTSNAKAPFDISILDSNLRILEESGQKWRTQGNNGVTPARSEEYNTSLANETSGKPAQLSPAKTFDTATTAQRQSKHKRMWLPITCSSSFHATSGDKSREIEQSIHLVALWSRTVSCDSCRYIPLDEEVQCGWDVAHSIEEVNPMILCPRCGATFFPLIGFKYLTLSEALAHSTEDDLNLSRDSTAADLPPQLEATLQAPPLCMKERADEGFVSYLSPYRLRLMLEQLVEEYGEEVLSRERLLAIDPQVFCNLWWYCARFSLPLPLAVAAQEAATTSNYCAFASWDKSVAMHGCQSAARAIAAAESIHCRPDRGIREKLFDNPYTDLPLLSFFNFQNYAQSDWEHPDLSEVLVALVKACETRDLLPVIECVFQRNSIRNQKQESCAKNGFSPLNSSFESAGSVNFSIESIGSQLATTELDCYRTVLYLARYQCMTAFHAFFPTQNKACKGYHFWCPSTPWSIFDRAFREAAQEYGKKHKMIVPIPDVSDVAIGFRSIFGQVI